MLNALHAHQVYKVVWDCNSERLSEEDFTNELRFTWLYCIYLYVATKIYPILYYFPYVS